MIKKADLFLRKTEEIVVGFLLLAATIVLFTNVVLRYVFNASFRWAEEAIRYACVWITLIGSSICVRRGSHVNIDLLAQVVPPKLAKIIMALGQFLAALFTAFCAYYGYHMFMFVARTGQVSAAMLMPMWIVYISVPIGCFLMTIRFIAAGVNFLRTETIVLSTTVERTEDGEIDLSRLS